MDRPDALPEVPAVSYCSPGFQMYSDWQRLGLRAAESLALSARDHDQGSHQGGGIFKFADTGRTKKNVSISDTGRTEKNGICLSLPLPIFIQKINLRPPFF